jgi:hypothetical protein
MIRFSLALTIQSNVWMLVGFYKPTLVKLAMPKRKKKERKIKYAILKP